MRRLGQVIGRCEATTPAPNVAEKNRAEGKARTRFFVARAADRRRSAYRPVMRCAHTLIIFLYYIR